MYRAGAVERPDLSVPDLGDERDKVAERERSRARPPSSSRSLRSASRSSAFPCARAGRPRAVLVQAVQIGDGGDEPRVDELPGELLAEPLDVERLVPGEMADDPLALRGAAKPRAAARRGVALRPPRYAPLSRPRTSSSRMSLERPRPARSCSRRTRPKLIAQVVERDLPHYDPAISERSVESMNAFAWDMKLLDARSLMTGWSRPSSANSGVELPDHDDSFLGRRHSAGEGPACRRTYRRRYTPNHFRGARDHRPARRQPAGRASASVQKYHSPREVLMGVRS